MEWKDAHTIVRLVMSPHLGQGDLPETLVNAKSVTKDEKDLARGLASKIRILHPDAIVIRQDLSVKSFQEYWVNTSHIGSASEVPLCIVNPTELNREALTQLLDREFYRRDYQHVLGLNGLGKADPKNRRYDAAVQKLRGAMDEVIEKAQNYVGAIHENYPPPHEDLQKLNDSYIKQRAIREDDKWFKERRLLKERNKVKDAANNVMFKIEDGCAPDLSDQDRDKIERFLRDQLAQLPLPMLKIMEDRDAQVWAADMLTYDKSGTFYGALDRRSGVIASLFDEPTVLFEEAFHFVDCLVLQGSQTPRYKNTLIKKADAYFAESQASREFVDEAIQKLVVEKTGVFDKHGAYANNNGESIPVEFMVNLAHLDQVSLTPINREKLGKLLHKHFPEDFPTDEPYKGESMGKLMANVCPKTWPHYATLCDMMHQEAASIDTERTAGATTNGRNA